MNQLANLAQGKNKLSFPVWLVMLIDVAVVNVGFALAFLLRFGWQKSLAGFAGLQKNSRCQKKHLPAAGR